MKKQTFLELIKRMRNQGYTLGSEIVPMSLAFEILHSKRKYIRKKIYFLKVKNNVILDSKSLWVKFSLPKNIHSIWDLPSGNEAILNTIITETKANKK